MANFNPQHKAVLDHMLVLAGKMFGFPTDYVGKKLCICLYEQGVGVKLPEATVARLLESDANAISFQSLGRPKMCEWVQINLADSQDYAKYEAVFHEAIRHVHGLQQKR